MKLFTTVQAAKILGIARDTLYRWIREGRVKGPGVQRVGEDVTFHPPVLTKEDLAAVRRWMKKNPYKGRGNKRKK